MAIENRWNAKQSVARAMIFKQGGDYPYSGGAVLTPVGIVAVYYQPADATNKAYLRLDFVHEGRCHTKVENKAATERGIVTIAHRFARDVIYD